MTRTTRRPGAAVALLAGVAAGLLALTACSASGSVTTTPGEGGAQGKPPVVVNSADAQTSPASPPNAGTASSGEPGSSGAGSAAAPGTTSHAAEPGGGFAGLPLPCSDQAEPRRLTRADRPTAALQCVQTREVVPADGEYEVVVRQRATDGLPGLVTALLLPSEPPPSGDVACLAYATLNWVVLEIGGKAVTVQTPVDACSHRLRQVDQAMQGLRWTEVSRTRGAKVRAAAAVDAQCEPWKDLFTYLPATELKAATAQPSLGAPGSGELKVCLFGVSYPAGWSADGSQGLDGVPLGGGSLTGDQSNLVRASLGKAAPGGSCSQRHTRFAVVSRLTPDGGNSGWLSVELDGCRRILTEDNRVSVAPDELVSVLAALAPKS